MKCQGFKESGEPCLAEASNDSPWCLWHNPDPEAIEARLAASSRGGRTRASTKPVDVHIELGSAEGILRTTQSVGEAIVSGTLDRGRANAVAYLVTASVQALKIVSYEKRLTAIEKRLGIKEDLDA